MKYFAQCCFTHSDGTCYQLSKEFESLSDAKSWMLSYMELFSDFAPIFDVFAFDEILDVDLESF